MSMPSTFNTRRLGPRPRPLDEIGLLPVADWTDLELLDHTGRPDARVEAVRRNLL